MRNAMSYLEGGTQGKKINKTLMRILGLKKRIECETLNVSQRKTS